MLYNIVYCRKCGRRYRIVADYVRPKVECRKCKLQFTLPPGLTQMIFLRGGRPSALDINRN